MNGIELCCRYAYQPTRLRYCGPWESSSAFEDVIINNKNYEKASSLLKKFEALYPYLELIAYKNKKQPFDYDVIEAYWIGNSLLDNFKKKDLVQLINKLSNRGLPRSYADNLLKTLPNALPHHSFHVLFVGVGKVTSNVETNIKNMDKCLIHPAKIVGIGKNALTVRYSPVDIENNKFHIGKETIGIVNYDKRFLDNLDINDHISTHWEFTCHKLNKKQLKNLEKYTQFNINAINSI